MAKFTKENSPTESETGRVFSNSKMETGTKESSRMICKMDMVFLLGKMVRVMLDNG